MTEKQLTKADIEAVFQRLRSIPANKTCFDCNAKNPTWASVTYGVFICIDCSATHRGLGVHLTFVRSTQLDINWTWMQLRQMQVGGNANALQFFTQHNCITADAQKKYNSRAAQLYRDKIHQLAVRAVQNDQSKGYNQVASSLKGNAKLHIQAPVEEKPEEKEVDFFSEHESFASLSSNAVSLSSETAEESPKQVTLSPSSQLQPGEGPNINFEQSKSEETRKPTIGVRKIQPKKSGLGAKKGGLGATKVKTNFADLEKEVALAEESRLRYQEETAKAAAVSAKEQEERDAAVRLAYKDLSVEKQKHEDHLKKIDPHKAEQMERLGMGFKSRSGMSHSILNDMQTIEQEAVEPAVNNLNTLRSLRIGDKPDMFLDYVGSFSMNRNTPSDSGSDSSKDNWLGNLREEPSISRPKPTPKPIERTPVRSYPEAESSDIAQKKFGSAKAISSDQFFHDRADKSETRADLSRFEGSSSISSADYFGNGSSQHVNNGGLQSIELDDVKESVRQGVTKVAGKISSLANGMMSSLQERYGY